MEEYSIFDAIRNADLTFPQGQCLVEKVDQVTRRAKKRTTAAANDSNRECKRVQRYSLGKPPLPVDSTPSSSKTQLPAAHPATVLATNLWGSCDVVECQKPEIQHVKPQLEPPRVSKLTTSLSCELSDALFFQMRYLSMEDEPLMKSAAQILEPIEPINVAPDRNINTKITTYFTPEGLNQETGSSFHCGICQTAFSEYCMCGRVSPSCGGRRSPFSASSLAGRMSPSCTSGHSGASCHSGTSFQSYHTVEDRGYMSGYFSCDSDGATC